MAYYDIAKPCRMRIRCAKCNKPVDKSYMEYSMYTMETIIVACCHGAKESMKISDRWRDLNDALPSTPDIVRAIYDGLIEGVAFVDKDLQIENTKRITNV